MLRGAAHPGIAKRIDTMTQTVALTGFGGLVVVALLTFYDGSARYVGLPRVSGFNDYGELVYPIVIASCFPAGLLRQSNVTVRFLGKLLPRRASMALEAFAGLLTLAVFAVLAWQFLLLTMNYAEAGRTTRTVEILLAPWWWIVTAIMALCVPVQLYVTLAWARAALTGQSPAIASL